MFGTKEPFSEVYPMIEQLRIEVSESGRGLGGATATFGSASYVLESFREYIDCSNPLCNNGGVRTSLLIGGMVRGKKTDSEFSKGCQGIEPSTRRDMNKPCLNRFTVKIHLDYKGVSAEPT